MIRTLTCRQRSRHHLRIAHKPRNSKRRQHAVKRQQEKSRRFTTRRNQDMRQQIHAILSAEQPKLIAVENLRPVNWNQPRMRAPKADPLRNDLALPHKAA